MYVAQGMMTGCHSHLPPDFHWILNTLATTLHELICTTPKIPYAPTILHLDVLPPIIPDNACILCLTAATGIELVYAYSPDTVIASSPRKEESGSCLSPSVVDHPLKPTIDHCLGKLLPHQLAN
ncbi:hypothetical protein VNO78_01314 [Psophocarpus tetragonolobus]|uniref:Uncharacterized protein n=1 Tax=Psophocarpus tetragonolobus TaxID=3891 RepID=A0AAN9SY82_PSOTE